MTARAPNVRPIPPWIRNARCCPDCGEIVWVNHAKNPAKVCWMRSTDEHFCWGPSTVLYKQHLEASDSVIKVASVTLTIGSMLADQAAVRKMALLTLMERFEDIDCPECFVPDHYPCENRSGQMGDLSVARFSKHPCAKRNAGRYKECLPAWTGMFSFTHRDQAGAEQHYEYLPGELNVRPIR